MAGKKKNSLRDIQKKLILLLEADSWRLTDKAESDGRKWCSSTNEHATQYDIIRFILELLKKEYPMHSVDLGEPPGSLGAGYVMNNADGKGLYVKLAIENELVWVLSFHRGKHLMDE